jgi:hypothetical protein
MKTADDGIVYGPIWLSKGERFRPTGAYVYLELRYKELQVQLRKLKIQYREITIVIKKQQQRRMKGNDNNETGDDGHASSSENTDREDKIIDTSSIEDKSLLSMSIKEIKEYKKVKDN